MRLRTPGNQNVLETRQLELLPLLFSWVALSRFWLSNISCLVPRGQVCRLADRLLAATRGGVRVSDCDLRPALGTRPGQGFP